MSCLLTLGKGAGTTSRVVSAQKKNWTQWWEVE